MAEIYRRRKTVGVGDTRPGPSGRRQRRELGVGRDATCARPSPDWRPYVRYVRMLQHGRRTPPASSTLLATVLDVCVIV